MVIPVIDESVRERLYGAPTVASVDTVLMSSGTQLFSEESIYETQHPLDIVLRTIFVEKRISKEYFAAKCREYALRKGYQPLQANTEGSNLVRTLQQGGITINRFLQTLSVLNLTLTDLQVSFRTTDGTEETYGVRKTSASHGKKNIG